MPAIALGTPFAAPRAAMSILRSLRPGRGATLVETLLLVGIFAALVLLVAFSLTHYDATGTYSCR